MQCPYCATEVESGEVVCPSCGAMRITGGSPLGVMVGWVGITLAVIVACMWSVLLVIPLTDAKLSDFPWLGTLIATALTAGLIWYSRATRKPRWVSR